MFIPNIKMNPADILAAANAFKAALKRDVVDAATIACRTEVCKKCPLRARSTGIKTRVSQILGNLANKHKVPADIADYACAVCDCSLMLLVPSTDKDQHKDSPEEKKKRPASCWLK